MPKKARPYHHGDLRAALLQAAIATVDEEGVAALSTRALARRLGVSHAAPARHFEDRTELLVQVAIAAFERLVESLERATAGPATPEETLAKLGRAYVRFALEHPGLLRVMFSAEVAERTPESPNLQAAGSRAYEALESAVRRTMPAKTSADEIGVATFLAWSSVHGAALLWLDGPLPRSKRDAKKTFLTLADAAIAKLARSIARS